MERSYRRLVVILHLQVHPGDIVWVGQLDLVASVRFGVDGLVGVYHLRRVAAVVHCLSTKA